MQVVFLLGFTSGIYALAGDPVTAIREGDLMAIEECEQTEQSRASLTI